MPKAEPPLKPNLRQGGGTSVWEGRQSSRRFERARPSHNARTRAQRRAEVEEGYAPAEPEESAAGRKVRVSSSALGKTASGLRKAGRTFRGRRERPSEGGRRAWRCRSRDGGRGRTRGRSRPCPAGKSESACGSCTLRREKRWTHRRDVHRPAAGKVEVACRSRGQSDRLDST